MATGTLSAPAISANGALATFTVTGGTWSGTLAVSGPTAIAFALTSEGHSGTTLTTKPRTVYGWGPTYAGGVITVKLTEPIHDDDTLITVTASANAIGNGTDTTAALGSTGVTNGSTLDYPQVACGIASTVRYTRQTSAFKIRGIAAAGCYAGHTNDAFGIAAMKATVTDSGGNSRVYTSTEHTTVTRYNGNGWLPEYPVFEVECNPSDRDGIGTDFAQGMAPVTLQFYPTIGDADSVKSVSYRVFLDPADSWDDKVAYVDTTSNISIGATAPNTFTAWKYLKGTTSLALGVVVGTQAGSGALVITELSGSFVSGETITEYSGYDYTSATGATATTSSVATANGLASGVVGDRAQPYQSIQRAGQGLKNATSHGTASHCTIYIKKGAARLGPYSSGAQFSTASGPVSIEPDPLATAGTVKFFGRNGNEPGTSGYDAEGVRTHFIRLKDFDADAEIVIRGSIPFNTAAATPTPVDASGEHITFENCKFVGAGREISAVSGFASGFEVTDFVGCSSDATWKGMGGIDCHATNVGDDIWTVSTSSNVSRVNCHAHALRAAAAGAHSGVSQCSNGATNAILWYCRAYDLDGSATGFTVQGPEEGSPAWVISRLAMIGCVQHSASGASLNNGNIAGSNIDSFFMYENLYGGTLSLATETDTGAPGAPATLTLTNAFIANNVFSIARLRSTVSIQPYTFSHNHRISGDSGAGTADPVSATDTEGGASFAGLFADLYGHDYTPVDETYLVAKTTRIGKYADDGARDETTAIGAYRGADETGIPEPPETPPSVYWPNLRLHLNF